MLTCHNPHNLRAMTKLSDCCQTSQHGLCCCVNDDQHDQTVPVLVIVSGNELVSRVVVATQETGGSKRRSDRTQPIRQLFHKRPRPAWKMAVYQTLFHHFFSCRKYVSYQTHNCHPLVGYCMFSSKHGLFVS